MEDLAVRDDRSGMTFADLELPVLEELLGFGGYANLGFGQGDAIALRTEELRPGSMGAFDEDQECEEAEHDRIGLDPVIFLVLGNLSYGFLAVR